MSNESKLNTGRPWSDTAPEFPVKPLTQGEFENGIIVRMPNWLGDAVMALPALMQLKKILPHCCGLSVICPAYMEPLFKALPIVDVILPLKQAHAKWDKEFLSDVFELHCGAGVLFNNSLRDAWMMKRAKVGRLYGAAARGRSFLLARSFRFAKIQRGHLHGIQHADRYLAIVHAMGAPEWNGELPEFKMAELPDLVPSEKLLTLAAGAAYGAAKRWPSENFRRVAEFWLERGGTVAVLGTEGEQRIGEEVLAGLPQERAFNLCGQTSIPELMHLLKSSRVTVANDSGLMHLAAALGTPGVAVYGPTDYTSTSPISAQWTILYQRQPCAPCFRRECPSGTRKCMLAITPEMVCEKIKDKTI